MQSWTKSRSMRLGADALTAVLLGAAMWAIFVVAPIELTMGHVQKILYVHVAVAAVSLVGFLAVAVASAFYLAGRDSAWDQWAHAVAEVGWVCCGLTIATGALWAHEAWGIWWTWDPRLTSVFVLWLMYSGYLLVHKDLGDTQRGARVASVLALLGAADVPFIWGATRWFRGIHPVAPHMEPAMRWTLWITVVAFAALAIRLIARRRCQLRLEQRVTSLERQVAVDRMGDLPAANLAQILEHEVEQ